MSNEEQVTSLVSRIVQAAEAYYNTSEPIMSDTDFDSLVDELRVLDPDNPILDQTNWGAVAGSSHLVKRPHLFEVGSLNKVQSVSYNRGPLYQESPQVESAKLDGISGVSYYDNGEYLYTLTRNDGTQGLDVSANLIYCNIPKNVNPAIKWVRGEIITTWDAAEKYDYSHPRNMAAGLANSKELCEAHKELHYVVYKTNLDAEYNETLLTLEEEGFEVVRWVYQPSVLDAVTDERKFNYSHPEYVKYPYPVDGSVLVNVNTNESFAVKYPTPIVEVEVIKVVPQVSPRGRVIPVIQVKPTLLSGAMINFCSGFNYEAIRTQGIGPGAIIKLKRANEVIPHWEGTVKCTVPEVPESVIVDGVEYFTKWFGVHLEINQDRTMDCIKTLLHWRTPHGVAGAKVDTLIEEFDIKTPEELATLASNVGGMHNHLKRIFGDTYYERMIELLELVNVGYTVAELLESTFSRNLGNEAATRLMKLYKNQTAYLYQDIISNRGLPEAVAKKMPSYVVSEGIAENHKLVLKVLDAGFTIKEPPAEVDTSSCIKICMTGKLSKSRSELITDWNGKVVEVDIKQATYLVTDNPTSSSSKNKEADKLGIKKVTEAEFRQIIEDNNE